MKYKKVANIMLILYVELVSEVNFIPIYMFSQQRGPSAARSFASELTRKHPESQTKV